MYGLMFLTIKRRISRPGLSPHSPLPVFWSYILRPILNAYLSAGTVDVIAMALGGTALVFSAALRLVLTTRKDMSFLGDADGDCWPVECFQLVWLRISSLQLPALHLWRSAADAVLISSGAILFETTASFMAVGRTIFDATDWPVCSSVQHLLRQPAEHSGLR